MRLTPVTTLVQSIFLFLEFYQFISILGENWVSHTVLSPSNHPDTAHPAWLPLTEGATRGSGYLTPQPMEAAVSGQCRGLNQAENTDITSPSMEQRTSLLCMSTGVELV